MWTCGRLSRLALGAGVARGVRQENEGDPTVRERKTRDASGKMRGMGRGGHLEIGGERVAPGETRDVRLKVSESYTGDAVELFVRVIRAAEEGPTGFLTAAVHGDEINGAGIIRELAFSRPLRLKRGSLLCLPVVNVFGFETHTRYLPDRRDLNRSFPGSARGSLASRFAHTLFTEIVRRCDFGIDLHTAAVRNTNFPNIRADLELAGVRRLAYAFGCELTVSSKGPAGSLRRAACAGGCPTIVLEAGEVWKVEPAVLREGVRGVRNALTHFGMLEGEEEPPPYRVVVHKTTWVRADLGGILRFHVAPGDLVSGGQAIATNSSLFGEARSILIAPVDGIVLGMTTLPAVKPGEPVCMIAIPDKRLATIRRALERRGGREAHRRLRDELAKSLSIEKGPPTAGRGRAWRKPGGTAADRFADALPADEGVEGDE